VLYIRNTIADAIESYRAIPSGVRAMLFHARFALCDRLARQAEALAAFDKESTPDRRAGRLLIATQVVEQSLDLDFDLIVSDLAPIDLIIQRAGRLWRHAARQRHPSARREMIIVGPEPSLDADTWWLSRTLQRTARVYDDHARMWLTAEALRRAGSIDAPCGLRDLIEHVYGSDVASRIPVGLAAALRRAETDRGSDRAQGATNTLRLADGYCRLGPWLSDEVIPTRLGADTRTLRLGVIRDGHIVPWPALTSTDPDLRRLWALSETRVPGFRVKDQDPAQQEDHLAETAKRAWSPWQRASMPLVVLTSADEAWTGTMPGPKKQQLVRYDRLVGLEFVDGA
jgi:CRISPR-associated endonuclease/helicase Cas3